MGKLYDRAKQRRLEEEAEQRPFLPPKQNWDLLETIGVPGVIYQFRKEVNGLYVRKSRGRVVLRTSLPLWLVPDHPALDVLRQQLRDLVAGRTNATGFSWRV